MKMRALPPVALAVLLVLAAATLAQQPEPTDVVIGKKVTLKSKVLGEDRTLQIFTPSVYAQKAEYPSFPVLYLLDGTDHFPHVAGLVSYLGRHGRIPQMVVVAVGNTDRTRDLTPTHNVIDYDGTVDHPDYDTSGGSGKFSQFIREELIPYVDKNYRTAPFRILDGHSFGGIFALQILFDYPETFQAYIAISPAVWWDNRVILKHTGPIGRPKQCLFISVGKEGGEYQRGVDALVAMVKERAAPGLEWKYLTYGNEIHNSVPHQSLYDALKFIFADWDIPGRGVFETVISYEDVVRHYQRLSEKYGFNIPIPESRLRDIALEDTLSWKDVDVAVQVLEQAVRLYPKSSRCYGMLADAYVIKGDKESAIKNYQKVLELNPRSESAKKALERLTNAQP